MLYMDLVLDNTLIWAGIPCLNGVSIGAEPSLPFVGDLIFFDAQGSEDPSFEGLGTRFVLLYFPSRTTPNVTVPLQATPAQRFNIVLAGQNCTILLYQKGIPYNTVYADDYAHRYYEEA